MIQQIANLLKKICLVKKAIQNQLHEIHVRINNIVHTITWSKKFSPVTHLYKIKLNEIKLHLRFGTCLVCAQNLR